MGLRDSRTVDDLLLQEIPADLVAYRMVQHGPPELVDFQSHYERRILPNPSKRFRAHDWLGVSVFEDRARAERLATTARGRGEDAWIAKLSIRSGAGIWGLYNATTTHIELFAMPHDLLQRVDTWE